LPAGGTITEGGGLTGAIKLKPAGGSNDNQALLIYPTAGADGDHVHLTAAGGTTELYLGNDLHYVKLVDGGNIELRATANLSAQASWNFDITGNIDARQVLGIKVPNGVPSVVATINSSSVNWMSNPMSNLATTGGSGSGLRVNVNSLSDAADIISIATPGTGYLNGELITVTSGSSSATFTIVIAGRNSWLFDSNGDLVLPGNLVIAGNTSIYGPNASLIQSNPDLPLLSLSSGSNGGVSSFWIEDIGNVGTSNIAAVYANPTPGSGIVRIAVGQNGSPGPNLWDFGADGNLTLPTFDSSASPLISSGITFGDGTYQYTASIAGATGPTGYTGSKGIQGNIGYTGSQGTIGVTGYTGSQGITGYTGSEGIQGNIGYTGSQGIQGNIGYTGSMSTIASSIATTGSVSTNSAHFLTFVVSNSGTNQSINTASNFTINPSSGLLTTFKVYVNGTTASTSTTTGALVVDGGIGIAGNAYIGGNVNTTGVVSAFAETATTTSTASSVGYLGTPINTQAGAYSLVIGDAGKTIYAGGNLTIPANANVAFPIGTIINVIASAGITIAITTDTLQWGGQSTSQTGTRTITAYGMASLVKVTATLWYINGSGVA
jgi:hypothetical protein